MNRRIYTYLGAVLSAFIFFAACRQPEPPEYRGFEQAQVSLAGASGTVLSAKIKFFNPNPFGLQLKRATLDVFLNDKHAGHSILDSTINIPGKDSFYIPVAMTVDVRSLFSNALQFLLKKEVTFRVEGKARLKKNGISFTVPLNYQGIQNLDSVFQAGF